MLGTPSRSFSRFHCPDAWAAGVCEHDAVDRLEGSHLAVPLYGGADLLGAGGDHKRRRGPEPVGPSLLGNVRGAAHVLIGGVRAASDQGSVYLVDEGVVRVPHLGGELGYRARPVGGVGARDLRLQPGQVDLDDPVEEQPRLGYDLVVGGKEGAVAVGGLCEGRAAGRTQVRLHTVVVCEHGGGGSQLGAHVGDRCLAGAAYGLGARPEVLDDGVGAA